MACPAFWSFFKTHWLSQVRRDRAGVIRCDLSSAPQTDSEGVLMPAVSAVCGEWPG